MQDQLYIDMDSMTAMVMGELHRFNAAMVFDWDEAARRIIKAGAASAEAGLIDDWGYTGGSILSNCKPVTSDYTYLCSTWAAPGLALDGGDPEPCWKWDTGTGWDTATKWPDSARAIIAEYAADVDKLDNWAVRSGEWSGRTTGCLH